MNEILGVLGTICICGAFYLIARKKVDEVKALEKCLTRSGYREDRLLKENIELSKTIEKCESMEAKQVKEFIEMQKEIDKLKEEKKELHETILFDNNLLIQKTEMLEQGAKKYSKDQITIADLNQQLCDANYKVVELEREMEGMVKRGFVKLERARLLWRR